MALREHWFSVMLRHGFPSQPAAHGTVMLARYALGFATRQKSRLGCGTAAHLEIVEQLT